MFKTYLAMLACLFVVLIVYVETHKSDQSDAGHTALVPMPSVVGVRAKDAVAKIDAAGLALDRSYGDDQHVCDQTPTFGTKLKAGSVVKIETAPTCDRNDAESPQDDSAAIAARRLCNEQPTEYLKRQVEEEFGVRCQ